MPNALVKAEVLASLQVLVPGVFIWLVCWSSFKNRYLNFENLNLEIAYILNREMKWLVKVDQKNAVPHLLVAKKSAWIHFNSLE